MGSKKRFDYKWVIVGVSAFMVFIVLGFFSSTKGLFIKAVTEALSIPRSMYSFNDSLRFIATAGINVFFGTLVMRYGTKKLIAAGFLLFNCIKFDIFFCYKCFSYLHRRYFIGLWFFVDINYNSRIYSKSVV